MDIEKISETASALTWPQKKLVVLLGDKNGSEPESATNKKVRDALWCQGLVQISLGIVCLTAKGKRVYAHIRGGAI